MAKEPKTGKKPIEQYDHKDKKKMPQEQIEAYCRKWKIKELSFFGSVLRKDFKPDSDVDVLVSFFPDARHTLFDHVDMQEELQNIFKRKVDLITRNAEGSSE